MTEYFDEKGKLFTKVVSKTAIAVIIQTTTHKIEGIFHTRMGDRLKDELNQPDKFLAITDAKIFSKDNQIIHQTKFLAINSERVVWLIPKSTEDEEDVQ